MNWESQGIALLEASVVRPFALVAAAWLTLRLLRVRHPASRHSVWTGVLVGMMVLPFVSVFAPHWMVPVLPAKRAVVAQAVIPEDGGFAASTPVNFAGQENTHAAKGAVPSVGTVVVWIYLAGLFAMVAYCVVGWVLLMRVISRSARVRGRLRESSDILAPVVVGVLSPVVILPAIWRDWSTSTKRAVLAHEFEHIRRRDTVVSALSGWVRCALWFHPLAWWISREISDLAELACDVAALERVGDPVGYARTLLEFAAHVNRAGHRATLPGLAMAEGSGMKRRIDSVFELSGGNLRKVSRPVVLAVFVPVVCLAATVGLGESGSHSLYRSAVAAAPTRTESQIAARGPLQVQPVVAPPILAQNSVPPRTPVPSAAAPGPKFDVAAIRLCKDSEEGPGRGSGGGARGQSPGRLHVNCQPLKNLIEGAYASDGPARGTPIEGGPVWIESDRYAIEAEAEGAPGEEAMRGVMMRALLEDRFQLKIHRASVEIPVYVLTVAKGGSKLQPFQEGSCTQRVPGTPRPGPDEKPWCGTGGMRIVRNGRSVTWDEVGASFLNFSTFFGIVLDRPVIDKTGITGIFDFHLEFAPDETTAGVASPFAPESNGQAASEPAGGPSIFTAFQEQLGLKLESAKGPGEALVIDHVARPSEN